MKSVKKFASVFALIMGSLTLSSCIILAPIIDSVQKAGLTESGRQGALATSIKDYHQALYWQRPNQALAFVRDDKREQLADQIVKGHKDERVVDSKVDYINWTNSSFEAEVDVVAKYYKSPFYIVHERIEKQQWEFSMVSGWKLVSIETKKDAA